MLAGGAELPALHTELRTLNTLGQISQVEDVVRLGRCWQEVGAHPEVDLHGSSDDGLRGLPHRVREVQQEAGQDGLQELITTD